MTPRLPRLVPLLLLAAVSGSACDWTEFDHLQLKTPVRALSRPEDMDSTQYPSFVVPITQPRGNAELVVIGIDNLALADFTFGPKGDVGIQTVSNDRFVLDGAKVGALGMAAYLPSSTDNIPRIATVTDEGWQPLVINLDSTEVNFALTAVGNPLPVEAGALAVGDSRGAGENDIAVAAGTQLYVLPSAGGGATQSCDLGSTVAALAVGDGWIVAGQGAGDGNAWLVKPDYAAAVGDPCADVTTLVDHSSVVGFGTALVVADIDGDGTRDIVVSAPQERTVYFYSSAGATLRAPKTFAGGSTGCGNAIAVGMVEGKRTLIVGDPGEPGVLAAPGTVWMVDLDTGDDLTPLERPNDDVQRFGTQVGVLSFDGVNGKVDLVWVTAEAATTGDPGVVYLYYWVHDAATEPRAI